MSSWIKSNFNTKDNPTKILFVKDKIQNKEVEFY